MLEGQKVILRLFREADLEEYLSVYSRYAERGEHWPITFQPMAQVAKDFRETGWWGEHEGRMLITDKAGQMRGGMAFFKGPTHHAGYEVGYVIFRRADRGQGFMSEALRIFSAYVFELKPIPRLQLCMFKGNAASRRVAEKCGYQHEGTMRKLGFLRGQWRDVELFSLLREECPSLAQALGG